MNYLRQPLLGALGACSLGILTVLANPHGGQVTLGSATFSSQGSQFTIRTSDRAFINWQSFNIGVGQTTTFIQPSATSVVWNQINDPNPSQILGNLNANGYVVLQNQSGFFIGGQASITTHGLLLTTAPIPMPEFSGGGAWDFKAPPPTASIINYGQINMGRGGSAFLLAHDIENHGTISVPDGQIGLYAGKEVLISERPDGRGLSAKVTLPEGSVDNTGKLIADAGTIALNARVVNQGGLIQANSVRQVNGRIELVASDSLNLGAQSVLTAQGDSQGVSAGGSILVRSDQNFSDQAGSAIRIGGGSSGGDGGQVEVSAPHMSALDSSIEGPATAGFRGGKLLLDPIKILLGGPGSVASHSLDGDVLALDVTSLSSTLSEVRLQSEDIEISSVMVLPNSATARTLTISAANNITIDDGAGIKGGNNRSVTLMAGTGLAAGQLPTAGNDGISLNGDAFIQTRNGSITLMAPNDIIVNSGAIRTVANGNITVASTFGNVNTGVNNHGYLFGQNMAPYYKVDSSNLGGISTAAGGNVNITAGGNVLSYTPTQYEYDNNNSLYDGGSGAFGALGGDVAISAGHNVYGHYVLANGRGTITAGGDIGIPLVGAQSKGFALSLIKGSWAVRAGGNIFVQDVRNPNGIFNDRLPAETYPGYHYFDYYLGTSAGDPAASVLLQAGNAVEITGGGAPHTAPSNPGTPIPLLFPPSLQVVAGPGGFVLDTSVILFPSPFGELNIATVAAHGGNFVGKPDFTRTTPALQMSDSGSLQWLGSSSFNTSDHALSPPELNNRNPVEITVAGDLDTVNLYTTKATHLTVLGNMKNSGFVGANLRASDTTSLDVRGAIENAPGYAFVHLDAPLASADALHPQDWNSVFLLAVDPSVASVDVRNIPNLKQYLSTRKVFEDTPAFVYEAATQQLGFRGPMDSSVLSALSKPLTVLVVDVQGNPQVDGNGHLRTAQYTFASSDKLSRLSSDSQVIPKDPPPGYQIGGSGFFNITAGSMDLGNTLGVLSWGIGGPLGDKGRYGSLAGVTPAGAEINVDLTGDLTMLTSTIASMYGGDVNVSSSHGSLDLGSQDLLGTSRFAFGVYTSGHSDVRVTAYGDVNINGSRIAAYNGGNVTVESTHGNVNAGSGGNVYVNVQLVSRDPVTGQAVTREDPIYGSGIVAVSLPHEFQTPGGNPLPGDITVIADRGDILSSSAGILQLALDGNIAGGPKVTLQAGTAAVVDSSGRVITPALPGNVDLGDSGLIGGEVHVSAQGNIHGLIVSRQSATINAAQSFSGTLLSAGTANVSAGGTVSGTVIGVGGANVSGAAGITANVLSQNATVNGGAAQSTLGASATATSTSQAAAQQANSDTQQQVAKGTLQEEDDKKKKGERPTLVRRVGRVTVILPPGS